MSGFTLATKTKKNDEFDQEWSSESDHETDFEEDQSGSTTSSLDFSTQQMPIDNDDDIGGPVIEPLPLAFSGVLDPDGDLVEDEDEDEDEDTANVDPSTEKISTSGDGGDGGASGPGDGTGDDTGDGTGDGSDKPSMEKALGPTDDTLTEVSGKTPVKVIDTGNEVSVSGDGSVGVKTDAPTLDGEEGESDEEEGAESASLGGKKGAGGGESGDGMGGLVFGTPVAPVDPILTDIWALHTGSTPEEETAYAEARFAEVTATAGANEAEVKGHAGKLASNIKTTVAARIATVTTAYDGAVAEIQGQYSSLRDQVDAAVDKALKDIDGQLSSSLSSIESTLGSKLGELNGGFDKAESELEKARTDGITNFTQEWEERVASVRTEGDKKAKGALDIAKGLASGWTGGKGIEAERNDARRKAALKVGKKFGDEIKQKANDAANSFASGAQHIPELVTELIKPTTEQVAKARIDSETALNDAANQAKTELERQATDARTSIRKVGTNATTALTDQENEAVTALTDARDQSTAALQATGDGLSQQLLASGESLASTYSKTLTQLQAMICLDDPPSTSDTDGAVDEVLSALNALRDQQITSMNDAFASGVIELDTATNEAVLAAGTTKDGIIADSTAAGKKSVLAIQQAATNLTDGMQKYTGEANKQLGDIAKKAVEGANQAVQAAINAITETQTEWVADLDESKETVLATMDASAANVKGEAKEAAKTAASKIEEKSWWDKAWDVVVSVVSVLASIIVAIVVFIAVAAFIIGTFGAGAVVLVAACAVAGAVAAVASKLAGDATKSLMTWSNQFSSGMEYLAAGINGFVTGGLAGVAMVFSVGVITAGIITAWGGALTDQLTDIGLFGEAFDLGELLTAGTLGSVLSFAGARFFPKNLGSKLQKFLLPGGSTGNSWNSFQSFCKDNPIFKNMSTELRAHIWNKIVSGKITGAPEEIVTELVKESIQTASPESDGLLTTFVDHDKVKAKEEEDAAKDLKQVNEFEL